LKKQQQLGMNPSTASNRLVKDTLWRLVVQAEQNVCYRCGGPMTRETFSIEHKEAWLDSDDPVGLYFDQENIGFSHLRCNIKDSRQRPQSPCGTEAQYDRGCRCDDCVAEKRSVKARRYTPEARHATYKRTGR
jgi:hypothetical protein